VLNDLQLERFELNSAVMTIRWLLHCYTVRQYYWGKFAVPKGAYHEFQNKPLAS
jgi:hypothetical protein